MSLLLSCLFCRPGIVQAPEHLLKSAVESLSITNEYWRFPNPFGASFFSSFTLYSSEGQHRLKYGFMDVIGRISDLGALCNIISVSGIGFFS